jgi:hypothetical protein
VADVEQDRYQAYSLGLKDRYGIPLVDILPFKKGDDGYTLVDFQEEGRRSYEWQVCVQAREANHSTRGLRLELDHAVR